MLSLQKKNRNIILKALLCAFSVFLFAGSASAWEMSFENNPYDMPLSSFIESNFDINAIEHGIWYKVNVGSSEASFKINQPFTGYAAYTIKCTSPGFPCVGIELKNSDGSVYLSTQMVNLNSVDSVNYHRVEWIENPGGTAISLYFNGNLVNTYTYTGTKTTPASIKFRYKSVNSDFVNIWVDDFTTSSSRAIIGMDTGATINDAGQYFRIGVPYLGTTKPYIVKVYSPANTKIKEYNLTGFQTTTEQLIPISNMSNIGTYTIHVYRKDSDSSSTFLTMKSFTLTDPAATGEGSIETEKTEYESGDTVNFWVHLNSYEAGYIAKVEFPTSGMTFKREIPITSDTFTSNFTLPTGTDITGSHTLYLINPVGNIAASDEFDIYIPGLPDIALDKSIYDRTDNVIIFYKNVKSGSSINVNIRYGGVTAQSLIYNVAGSGSISLNLNNLPAADSIYVNIKDSDGYTNDQDNAKIIVGNFIITGRVYDAKTGAVVPAATVTVQGNTTNTDINGNYNLSSLSGFANYSVTKTGYNNITGTVAVFDLETLHNFYLTPVIINGGTGIYGTIVSSKTDYPLAGALIEVTNTDNLKRYSTIADKNGYYSMSHDDLNGNLTVRVSLKNYDSVISNVLVNAGSMVYQGFRLQSIPGYEEIDPYEHDGGQDPDNPDETAEEKANREKYGEYGRHPFDSNGDGEISNSEWKYNFQYIFVLVGCLAFMGFLNVINRRR